MINRKEITKDKLTILKISYFLITTCISSLIFQFIIKDGFLFITLSIILGFLGSFIPNIFYKIDDSLYKDLK